MRKVGVLLFGLSIELVDSISLFALARVVHGSVLLENVCLWSSEDVAVATLSNLRHARVLDDEHHCFMGRVSKDGHTCYSSGILPPEMFVELSHRDLEQFEAYWRAVSETSRVSLDEDAARVSFSPDGKAFAVRSFYHGEESTGELPELPYDRRKLDARVDIWAFGCLAYQLLAGCSFFPLKSRSGSLLSFSDAARCDDSYLERMIVEHVEDYLAQDFLFTLLDPISRRVSTMMEVLLHPFLAGESSVPAHVLRGILEKRKRVAEGYRRRQRMILAKSEV